MKKYFLFLILISAAVFFGSRFSNASKPSDFGLKEGDLISAIFSDDPDVYIINEHGFKRLFLNPEIFKFYAHLGGFTNVKLVTPEIRDSFPTAGFFRNCEDNDQKVFGTSVEGEDQGKLHWINKSGDQAVQEDPDFFKKVFCINRKEFNWYPRGTEFKELKEVPQYHRTVEVENPVVCHHPTDQPNEPKNYQTIRVAPESLDAHFQHGDTKGACSTPFVQPPTTPVPTISVLPIPMPIYSPSPTPTTAVYLVKPMMLKDILKIESVIPFDVANLGFGVYQVSAQYNLGSYHQGKWYEGLNPGISEAVWIEFGWPNMPQVDVVLRDENNQQRKIYLPATGPNKNSDGSVSNWYYWIGEDGSSYYARKDHNYGWPDLSSVDALRPEHLARKAGGTSAPTLTPTPTSTTSPTPTLSPSPTPTPTLFSPLFSPTPTPTETTIVISNVTVTNITTNSATLTFTTNIAVAARVSGIFSQGAVWEPPNSDYTRPFTYISGSHSILLNQLGSLQSGKTYNYELYVFDANGRTATYNGSFTTLASPTPTPTPTPTTPQPPSSVTISLLNSTTYYDVEVRWTASAIKYKIYRSTNGGEYQLLMSFFPANNLNVTATYYDDAWVSPSTTYRYKIYGCNNDGGVTCSLMGTESNSITTRAAPTPTPTPTPIQVVNCYVKIDGVVVKSVYATDRNNCYSQTSFGSANCSYYTSYFTAGTHFLEQYFGATDRVNNEYCTCQGGVCTQGATSSLLESRRPSNFAAITRNLTVGSTGNDVKQLQTLLVNEVGYSADLITGYFGRITRDAVKRLQEKYGIKPTYGYFGAITRRTLNALVSGQ